MDLKFIFSILFYYWFKHNYDWKYWMTRNSVYLELDLAEDHESRQVDEISWATC